MSLRLRLKESQSSPEEERAIFPETVQVRHTYELKELKYCLNTQCKKDKEKQGWSVMKAICSKISSLNFILKYVEIYVRVYPAI